MKSQKIIGKNSKIRCLIIEDINCFLEKEQWHLRIKFQEI